MSLCSYKWSKSERLSITPQDAFMVSKVSTPLTCAPQLSLMTSGFCCPLTSSKTSHFQIKAEGIIIHFWETAYLPLPWANINTYFSHRAQCRLRGGVGRLGATNKWPIACRSPRNRLHCRVGVGLQKQTEHFCLQYLGLKNSYFWLNWDPSPRLSWLLSSSTLTLGLEKNETGRK